MEPIRERTRTKLAGDILGELASAQVRHGGRVLQAMISIRFGVFRGLRLVDQAG